MHLLALFAALILFRRANKLLLLFMRRRARGIKKGEQREANAIMLLVRVSFVVIALFHAAPAQWL
jgi:hypothetical protein